MKLSLIRHIAKPDNRLMQHRNLRVSDRNETRRLNRCRLFPHSQKNASAQCSRRKCANRASEFARRRVRDFRADSFLRAG